MQASPAAPAPILPPTRETLSAPLLCKIADRGQHVEISLLGFLRISNAIGGVPVVLCTAQKEPNSGINLPAGRSVLQGQQAMAFVRQRDGVPGTDLGRIARQQYFLKSAFHTLLSSGSLLFKVRDVLKAVAAGLREGARTADWMTNHPETIESSDTTEHAAALMIHGGFRHLPVVDRGELLGLVSIGDVVKARLEEARHETEALRAYIVAG